MQALVLAVMMASATASVDEVRTLRLRGELDAARALAESALAEAGVDPDVAIELHLELASIEDRVGLHRNTRPVALALEHVRRAEALVERASFVAEAKVELAKADYYYRAEMSERQFPTATVHADRAIELFRGLNERRGEADAVHRRGLIAFQRRELELARRLFVRSLELDRISGERVFFRGEYERHMGFIYLVRGEVERAIPYFERSLAARREAGAIDASMFAAVTLASALVDVGRFGDALPHVTYAMMLAEKFDSPVGKSTRRSRAR